MKTFFRRDRGGRRGNLNFCMFFSLRSLRLCGRSFTFFRLPHPIPLLILLIFSGSFTPGLALAESLNTHIQAGIENYNQQHFDQAEINFSKAQKEQPDNPELNYNLANSHYKNGKYQEALKSYGNAASDETRPDLQQNSLYNSANALFRMGKLEESIAAYKKVLEMNPGDMDAKFNLEFTREKLKEKNQPDQKQKQPKDGNSDDSEKSEQNPSPENDSDDKQDDTAQKENQEPVPPKEPEQNADSSSSEQQESSPSEVAQNPENAISKNQAEQWLRGLDEDLKKFSQKQAQKEGGNTPVSSRDW